MCQANILKNSLFNQPLKNLRRLDGNILLKNGTLTDLQVRIHLMYGKSHGP
ncbi:hypothetical protein SAMN04490192_1320 [Pseudomonas lundensis]|jgi:DNA-binding MltR family transcriptional regulator|nr:hypothetical protein SAMN04490192_1320 [Pseudomonas lundensis]